MLRLKRFMLLTLVLSILITLVACSGNSNIVPSPQPAGSLQLIPIEKFMGPAENGYVALHLNTAVANLSQNLRFFIFNNQYTAKVSSSESRKESVTWDGYLERDEFLLPPGFVVRLQRPENIKYLSDIAVHIPQNMTNIQLNVPYIDMPISTGERFLRYSRNGATPNQNAYLDLDTDFRDVSSIKFPIMDSKLTSISKLGETVNLENSKLVIQITDFQAEEGKFFFNAQIKNTNSLETGKWWIALYGAGSDGIGLIGEAPQTGACSQFDTYHTIELNIGPSQDVTCNFFYRVLKNISNIYIWIVITNNVQDGGKEALQDYAVFFLGQ